MQRPVTRAAPQASPGLHRPPTRLRERRRFYRTPARVKGRLLDMERREQPCLSLDLSPGGARLEGPAPAIGSMVVLYFDRIGRVSGKVVRVESEQRFAVAFNASARRREIIAEELIVLLNETRLSPEEAAEPRRSPRYVGSGAVTVELDDGGVLECQVLDYSLVGASLRCAANPPRLGAWVRAGASYGRVARYLDGGFAIDFAPRRQGPPPKG